MLVKSHDRVADNPLCVLSLEDLGVATLQYSCLESPMDGGAW